MADPRESSRRALERIARGLGIVAVTGSCFLVLPMIQAIGASPTTDLLVQPVATADLPPPPPPVDEPEPEPEPEAAPPELAESAAPLDLAQLELSLEPGGMRGSGGWMPADHQLRLHASTAGGEAEAMFSLADLDQAPRAIHQPAPVVTAELARRAPATVHVLFQVDATGRVESPIVQQSTDAAFDRAALAAVGSWRFEPGRRDGQAVRFRMRVPITFPARATASASRRR